MEADLSENLEESYLRKLFKENLLFLISAILLDTTNFSKEDFNTRWTSLDKLAYEKVKELNNKYFPIKFSEEISDAINLDDLLTANYFKELSNSKYDEKANLNLGVPKIFNKDKKDFSYTNLNIFWSSLPINLDIIFETFSENLVENYIEEHIKENFLWVISYQKKEKEIKYSYLVIYLNKKNNKE
jgi:hypothetical protein